MTEGVILNQLKLLVCNTARQKLLFELKTGLLYTPPMLGTHTLFCTVIFDSDWRVSEVNETLSNKWNNYVRETSVTWALFYMSVELSIKHLLDVVTIGNRH